MSEGEAQKSWCIQLTCFLTIDPKLQDQLGARERLSVESWNNL